MITKHAKRKAGEKAGLTSALIIAEALALLKENSALSITGIAGALGVAPTAVYFHFPKGLDEIVTEMVRTLLANVARPFQPNENWDAYLQGLFRAVYDAFHKHPRAARFAIIEIASNYYINPLLVERILFALSLAGVPEVKMDIALDQVMGSLIGMLALEFTGLGSTSALKWLHKLPDASNGTTIGEYPQTNGLKGRLVLAIKARNILVRHKPTHVTPQCFADHLIAGLKANFSKK